MAPEGAAAIAGSLPVALKWLGIVWTWAAFGEEFGYRGYLLARAADLGEGLDGRLRRRDRCSWRCCSGSATSTRARRESWTRAVAGLVLGAAFLVSGRNLWACVLAHGFIDTFGSARSLLRLVDLKPAYLSSPMISRYHFGWWSRAQAFVTVPRVIEPNVPGSAAVPR